MQKDNSRNRAAVRLTEDEKRDFDVRLKQERTNQQAVLYRAVREFLGGHVAPAAHRDIHTDILRTVRRSAEQILDAVAIAEQRHEGSGDLAAHGSSGGVPTGGAAGHAKGGGRKRKLTAAS